MAKDYLKKIQEEIPPFTPYEDEDLGWWNEGLDHIDQGQLAEAESKFKMLVICQPDQSDGYEGLARVYSRTKRLKEAKFFIDLAIEKVKKSIEKGYTDEEMLDLMLEQKKAIEKKAR